MEPKLDTIESSPDLFINKVLTEFFKCILKS
jgi:hypothetical protein